ncbi:Biotin carboxyl carrier protein of acetyl-CoA carboxylase [Linum grandiflorum]
MDSSVALRSFRCPVSTVSSPQSLAQRTCAFSLQRNRSCFGGKLVYSPAKRSLSIVSCANTTSDSAIASKPADSVIPVESEKDGEPWGTFPSGLEALLLEVCDETEVAELKLKVGDFEMHLRRDVGATTAPLSNMPPAMAPPIPSEPMTVTAPAMSPASAPPSPPQSSAKKSDPFINTSFGKSPKLTALEASGATGYVLVASPIVGSYRKTRTVKKGKPKPRFCKEGDMIKEGQVIAYLDQFGTELPVRSDVAGEVLKIFFEEGDAVGYKDPLMAVLPSFPGIQVQ